MAANFTNEGGVDGRTRFLRNVGGLWLLQESMRAWGRDDVGRRSWPRPPSCPTAGRSSTSTTPVFIPPGDMPQRIADAAGRRRPDPGGRLPGASSTRWPRPTPGRCSRPRPWPRTPVEVIHVVGGGSANDLLCQRTADLAGLPVIAGPVEATALGNVVVQARAAGALAGSLADLRAVIAASVEPAAVRPDRDESVNMRRSP